MTLTLNDRGQTYALHMDSLYLLFVNPTKGSKDIE